MITEDVLLGPWEPVVLLYKPIDYGVICDKWIDVLWLFFISYKLILYLVLSFIQVLHSQSIWNTSLEAWIIAEKSGRILGAHCTCVAGLEEVCTHVAALLFLIKNWSTWGTQRQSHKKRLIGCCCNLPQFLPKRAKTKQNTVV